MFVVPNHPASAAAVSSCIVWGVLLALLLPRVVGAEERIEVWGRRVPMRAVVMDRQEIEALAVWTVPELLRYMPGVDVVRTGGLASQVSLFLRGGNSNHTLVLVDGVRINDPLSGLADLSLLAVDAIERIELTRGPQGASQGSNAMGGVIHIHTRQATRQGLSLLGEAGRYQSYRQAAALSAVNDRAAFHLQLSRQQAAGFSIAAAGPAGQPPATDDAYRLSAAHARLAWQAAARLQGELGLQVQSGWRDIDNFAGGVLVDDPDYRQWDRSLQAHATARLELFSGAWQQQLRLSNFRQRRRLENGPQATTGCFGCAQQRGSHYALEWLQDWLSPAGPLRLGLLAQGERTANPQQRLTDSSQALWLESEPWAGPWQLALRHEDHDAYGGHTSWHVGLRWPMQGDWHLHSTLGTAYRTPGTRELHGPYGNPALRPERSLGWELGIARRTARWQVELAVYQQHYSNLLEYDAAVMHSINSGGAVSRGLELSLGAEPIRRVRLQFEYSYTDAYNRDTGLALLRRPRHKFSARLQRAWSNWQLQLALRHIGQRHDRGNVTLAAYTVGDVAVQWQWHPSLQLRLRVENLNDRDYSEVMGYHSSGRALYAGFRYTPGGRS